MLVFHGTSWSTHQTALTRSLQRPLSPFFKLIWVFYHSCFVLRLHKCWAQAFCQGRPEKSSSSGSRDVKHVSPDLAAWKAGLQLSSQPFSCLSSEEVLIVKTLHFPFLCCEAGKKQLKWCFQTCFHHHESAPKYMPVCKTQAWWYKPVKKASQVLLHRKKDY